MNTRYCLAIATHVGLIFSVMPALGEITSNALSRYTIITKDGVSGEVVQPPATKH